MIKIALIDDNSVFSADFETQISNVMTVDYSFSSFKDFSSFQDCTNSGSSFNIVFVDIMLENENGISAAKQLIDSFPDICIIFISSCRDFFMDVYKVPHCYFLAKPIDREHLNEALRVCIRKIQGNTIKMIYKGKSVFIPVDKIVFIESRGKKLIIHYSDNSVWEFNFSLNEFSQLISGDFIRTHQSYIINMNFITGYLKKKHVTLDDQYYIPISRKYINETDKSIIRYLGIYSAPLTVDS